MKQSTFLFLIKSDKNHNSFQNSFVKCLEILLKYVWFPIWTIFGLDYSLFCSTLNFYFTAKDFPPSASENVRNFSAFIFEEFWANSVRCWRMYSKCCIFVGDFHVSPSLGSLFGCPDFLIWKNRMKWISLFYWGWLVGSPNRYCLYAMKNHIYHLATL